MPYDRKLLERFGGRGREELTERQERQFWYDNLAAFIWHVSTRHGRHMYSYEAVRNGLAASHVITKDGTVHQERLQDWADSRGIDAALTEEENQWYHVLEGQS